MKKIFVTIMASVSLLFAGSIAIADGTGTPSQGSCPTGLCGINFGNIDLSSLGTCWVNSAEASCSGGPITLNIAGTCSVVAENECGIGNAVDLADTATHYRWKCEGVGSGADATCSLAKPNPAPVENGQCGSSRNSCSKVAFRDRGDTTTQYRWYCDGSNGGNTASCSMAKPVATATPECGEARNTCKSGNFKGLSNTSTTYRWICFVENDDEFCAAPREENGSCGSSDGGTFSSKPTSGLCSSGTASSVSGSGPWSWTCSGSNGGSSDSCSASKTVTTTYTHYTTGSWSACSGSGSWTWNSSTGEGIRSGTQTRTVTSYTDTNGPSDSEPASSQSCTETTSDTTAPTCSVSTNLSNWYSSDISVTALCSDSGSGCTQTVHTTTLTSNGQSHTFTVYDNAGNSGTCTAGPAKIDTTDPTVSIDGDDEQLAGGTWTVSASDSPSGVATTAISVSPSAGASVSGNTITITSTGSFDISVLVEDEAGNSASASKTVTVYPNQMDASQSSISLASDCNNGSWDADATDKCRVTVELKDQYGNALNNKPFQISGVSDTPLDAVHNTTPSSNGEEAIIFAGDDGIQSANSATTDASGEQLLDLQAYAPGSGSIDFTIAVQTHTAANYPGSGSYNITDSESENYQIERMFDFSSISIPSTFQKNAAKTATVTIRNNIPSANNERIGLYAYTGTSGGDYSVTASGTGTTSETTSTWIASDGASNLGANYSNDALVFYTDTDLATDDVHNFTVQFTKQSGEVVSQTSVNFIPFVRMELGGKDVAYPLNDTQTATLYNQAVGVTDPGGGLTGGGSGVQSGDTDEASDSSIGSLSIASIQADLKEVVRKESLNLSENTVAGTIITLSSFSNVHNINNGRTYIVKGDDLIIDTLTIGEEPLAFISHGGNVIIRGNIQYNGANSINPTIAIISLRDETTGQGGEVQVYDNVTSLIGSYFAERGIVSTDGTTTIFTEQERINTFDQTLSIEGSLFGGNTLGGADNDPVVCPSFIRASDCSTEIAQKYDLNYLRRVETENPVVIDYYVNKEYLPKEMQ